jgi:Cu-Zn family superoxide dismutase
MNKKLSLLFVAVLTLTLFGCNHKEHQIEKAIAVISPTAGNETHGIVTFTKVEEGVRVQATVTGLTPGDHGFHIHQFGDISRPDGVAAGGHFNPLGHDHAHPDAEHRHVGDLGNITADQTGYGYYDRVDTSISFSGLNSVIGRAVIVHEFPDDKATQPTGGAGPRVGQGVIGIAK